MAEMMAAVVQSSINGGNIEYVNYSFCGLLRGGPDLILPPRVPESSEQKFQRLMALESQATNKGLGKSKRKPRFLPAYTLLGN